MKIGISQKSYPIIRNIFEKVPGAEYVVLRKNNNLFHGLSTLWKLLLRKKINIEGKYYFYQSPKLDVLHLYNDINYSKQKWVTTFETLVPRFDETKNDHQKENPNHLKNKNTAKAFKVIAKKNCKGIIAISQASANIQLELLKNYPEYSEDIQRKLFVVHPPQKIIERNHQNKYSKSEVLNLIFVGTQFHLKGGWEMYEVLKILRSQYNFRLTVISSFKTDHYVTKVSQAQAKNDRNTLEKEEWIEIYSNITNNDVIELIKKSHVGLLPTWSDTYGFSVLEMQASGIPVISTDIRALPEINNEECGWLINLPQNRLKQALYYNADQKEQLKETLKYQLEKILTDIFEHPEQIHKKSQKSIERIKKFHNPEEFGKKLMTIYQN